MTALLRRSVCLVGDTLNYIKDESDLASSENEFLRKNHIDILLKPFALTSASKKKETVTKDSLFDMSQIDLSRKEMRAKMFSFGYASNINPKKKLVLLLEATVGAGKSFSGGDLIVQQKISCVPTFVVAPTKDLCRDWVKDINEKGGNAVMYRPREHPAADGSYTNFTCWQLGVINHAGAQHQRPAQSICKKCPHAIVRNLEDDSKSEEAKKWFSENNLNPADFKSQPCQFLFKGLPDQLKAHCLVLPAAAFSDAVGEFKAESGEVSDRFGIIDESFELAREIRISPETISKWVDSLLKSEKIITKMKNSSKELALMQSTRSIFNKISTALTSDLPLQREEILDLYEKVSCAKELTGGTASWEVVKFQSSDRTYQIVHRAFAALANSIKFGVEQRVENGLLVFEVSQLTNWVKNHGNCIVMDATMPSNVKKLFENSDYHFAKAKQNMNVTRLVGHRYFRGNPTLGRFSDTAKAVRRDMLKIVEQPGNWSVLTHKATVAAFSDRKSAVDAALIFEKETGQKIGWFGKHDRGLDAWKHNDLAILGTPLLSVDAILANFAKERAALIMSGVDCEKWDGLMDDGKKTCGVPFPTQASVREWLLDYYTQGIVQAIGRARAATSSKTIQIQLFGGLSCPELDAALAARGVEINSVRQNDIHNFKAGRIKSSGERDVINEAVSALQARGLTVNRQNIRQHVTLHGFRVNDKEIDGRLVELRKTGTIPTAKKGRPPAIKTTQDSRELIGWNSINIIERHSTELNSEVKHFLVEQHEQISSDYFSSQEFARNVLCEEIEDDSECEAVIIPLNPVHFQVKQADFV